MGNNKRLIAKDDEVVPTHTLAAAFAIALVMGFVVVTGIVFKPYEAKEVVEELHQRILYEKEMREMRRISYAIEVVHYAPTVVSDVASDIKRPGLYSKKRVIPPSSKKTERAESFDREVRSDSYWASLNDSVRNGGVKRGSKSSPVVIPPVIIGSAD